MCTQIRLNQITKEVVRGAKDILGDKLFKVILYGSYARGDFDEDSDIDIMVLADSNQCELGQYRNGLNRVASRVGLDYDIMISAALKDKEGFYKHMDILPFYQNVINEGVEIYGE